MQRHGFGLFGLLFLIAYGVIFFRFGFSDAEVNMVAGICLRVGLVLCTIWLALPQLKQITQRVPPWMFGCILLALAIVIIRPRYIVALAPVLGAIAVLQFVGWLVKPLPQKRRPRPQSGNAQRRNRT
ncbi:MAG: hypothetical protein ACC628_08430 [Pirellulaceae bacterium]